MTNQMTKRSQVRAGKNAINAVQDNMPSTGNKGLNGERNGRFMSGWVMRSTNTPKQTSTKAAKVPMLTSSAKSPRGIRPAIIAMVMPDNMITRTGV